MNSIKEILKAFGFNNANEMPQDEYIEVSVSGFDDLVIERIAKNRLSVAHTYTQRMDMMRNPELVFDTSTDNWIAVMYQDDPTGAYEQSDEGLKGKTSWAKNTWDKNLSSQGFITAAQNQDSLN